MLNNSHEAAILITLVCILLIGGAALMALTTAYQRGLVMNETIKQCEVELPRHQHCEAVYSASVVEEAVLERLR